MGARGRAWMQGASYAWAMEAPLEPDGLAWTALLARWVEFAQAAKALPAEGEGARWRAAVPQVITLQAVAMALGEMARVPPEERALARDRAELLISGAVGALDRLWRGEPMPEPLLELAAQARAALEASAYPGLMALVCEGPGELVVPEYGWSQPGGTLLAMAPGTVALAGEVVALWSERPAPEIPGCRREPAARLRQLYRTFDDAGRWTGSFERPLEEELAAGMPMLLPFWLQGEAVAHPLHPAPQWLAMQRAAGISASGPAAR